MVFSIEINFILAGQIKRTISKKASCTTNLSLVKMEIANVVITKYHQCLKTEVKRGLARQENLVFPELVRIANLVRQGESIQLCCWCHPQKCHGDIIKACIEWLIDKKLI
jgi:hypothetical protein